jgi:hypothetical protein
MESPFDECGAIRTWNILGAYDNPAGGEPSVETMRLDFMTDGQVGEVDFEWAPGATIDTAFGVEAASSTIEGGAAGRNPGGVPTVFSRTAPSGRVNLQSPEVFGSDLNYVMVYAQAYVVAEEETEVYMGIVSDDSVQVIVNGQEEWINSFARGAADPCTPQDVTQVPVILEEGYNSLVVKVFDGEGDWELGLRFQDALEQPVTDGLDIRLSPPEEVPPEEVFVRGDANSDDRIDLTDGIAILSWLYLGADVPPCLDAADADDGGDIQLTDAVRIFNWLFLGGEVPPLPTPSGTSYVAGDCGPDETDDDELDCVQAAPLCDPEL